MGKLKIAVISNDDKVFSFYARHKVFTSQILTKEYECVGFWTCHQKFKKEKGFNYWTWYLRTFRLSNFLKLFSFVISFKILSLIKSLEGKHQLSFKKLCSSNGIPFSRTTSPNSPEFIAWVKANSIDILVIMVDYILKKDILCAPKICVLNKHAGLLPTNKGLFPFFWATIARQSQGVTFHKVNEKIDEGDFYYQQKVTDRHVLRSMISFYFYVHHNYHSMLSTALKNIVIAKTIPADEDFLSSYNRLPTTEDYMAFRKNGGKIIILKDIFLPFALLKK